MSCFSPQYYICLKESSGPKFLQLTDQLLMGEIESFCKWNLRTGIVQAREMYDDVMLTINEVQVFFKD